MARITENGRTRRDCLTYAGALVTGSMIAGCSSETSTGAETTDIVTGS